MMVSFGTQQWQWSMISADFPNRVPHKCDDNSMMGAPYPHPLHSMIMSITLYMFGVDFEIIPCGMRASTAAWRCCHLAPSSDPWFQPKFQIGSHKCDGNTMMGAIYPHSLHMKFVNMTVYMFGVDVGIIPCGTNNTIQKPLVDHVVILHSSDDASCRYPKLPSTHTTCGQLLTSITHASSMMTPFAAILQASAALSDLSRIPLLLNTFGCVQ